MLSLAQTHFLRGSGREAEYVARQAAELAEQLNAPAMRSHALTEEGKIQLHMGLMDDAQTNLSKAAKLVSDHPSIDAAEIRFVFVELKTRMSEQETEDDSQRLLDETAPILGELDEASRQFDNLTSGCVCISPF